MKNCNFTTIKESNFSYFDAAYLKNNKIVFPNVCECACFVIWLKNGDIFVYHKFFSDGKGSLLSELEIHNINDENVEKVQIFGGNINYRCMPDKNTTVIDLKLNEQHKGGDIIQKYKLTDPSMCFEVESRSKCAIPLPDKIIYGENLDRYNNNVKKIIEESSEVRAHYKNYTFTPKYEEFCGTKNLKFLHDLLISLNIQDNKIEFIKTPLDANVAIDTEKKTPYLINFTERYYCKRVDRRTSVDISI